MGRITEEEFLAALRERGASRLKVVQYRPNRRTIWSLTRNGTVLNLHEGYGDATPELIRHFAQIVADPRGRSPASRAARAAVKRYHPLRASLERLRKTRPRRSGNGRRPARRARVGPNCATPPQQAYLDGLYAFLNRTRFRGSLPHDVPIRLSARMKSTYGWVTLRHREGVRKVGELALNLDLMLAENDGKRLDIMLHEMAHVEAWLVHGERGHGATWKRIARRLGCEPAACTRQTILRRGGGGARVTRVPPLPHGARP
jgi:hypothetical protein